MPIASVGDRNETELDTLLFHIYVDVYKLTNMANIVSSDVAVAAASVAAMSMFKYVFIKWFH